MKTEFDNWWDKDLLTEDNPHVEGTPAFWAWEGWVAGVNAEREACAKRRGVLAFCPYTGRPRHPSDIASDPHGILILVPDQPIRARGQS